MADDQSSGESTSNGVGGRRRSPTLPYSRRRRGIGEAGGAGQDGDNNRNSVQSSESEGTHRRDNRPPSHRSVNDIVYQGQGRMGDLNRPWPIQFGPQINNLEVGGHQPIEDIQEEVFNRHRDEGVDQGVVDHRLPIQANDEVAMLQDRIRELEIQNERLRNNCIRNNVEPRPAAPRRSTQEQVNGVSKAIRIANLTFNGDIKKTNPIWFIESIQDISYEELVGEEALKRVFKAALKGTAAQWARFADTGTYQQLQARFIEKFWSESIQREIAAYIRTGAHDGSDRRETYFLRWAAHGRHLNHYIDEEEIVNALKYHFSENVVDRIEMRQPQTIWDMAKLLAELMGQM